MWHPHQQPPPQTRTAIPFALSLSKPVLRALEGGLLATDIPALAGTHAPLPSPAPMLPPEPLLPYPSGTLPQPHT